MFDPNTQRAKRQLHICPECQKDLVYPEEWQEIGSQEWQVILRCPNCELWRTLLCHQDELDAFDIWLDDATEAVHRDLKRLAYSNMESEIERFVRALQSDAILPEDFRPLSGRG
ncbi:MAG TPA: hypothetical protein VNA68_01380 [Candidatus Dormibacteraeota bacterium]|nr:hypothetical protein [Candidatus Dormibacteraeota bacterium]